ncbi:unnamed protein product [Echinostoma caproni]|uniref:LSM14 domain-containing protein n=1 Tax=Echinostoma caproni TaxID=27848 RepID=A0A183B9N6_9TREM|nr:unnamed protein product [Echinostoma caproni]
MVRGSAANYPKSKVYGSIVNGVFRGTIVMDLSKVNSDSFILSDSYFVEPAGYYFEDITEFHSIIYHSSHVRQPERHMHPTPEFPATVSHFCGLSDPLVVQKMQSLSMPTAAQERKLRRAKRDLSPQLLRPLDQSSANQAPSYFATFGAQTGSKDKKRVCNLLLQSDTFLWNRVMKIGHVKGDVDAAVTEITSILTQHVQSAQAIFHNHVFRDHSVSR